MEGRKLAHQILDQFDQEVLSEPTCIIAEGQSIPDFSLEDYSQALDALRATIELAHSNATEGHEAFISSLVEVLYFRQVLSKQNVDADAVRELEDTVLDDQSENFMQLYEQSTTKVFPAAENAPEQQEEHVKNENVHAKITAELSGIFEGALNETLCLHWARFTELKAKIEQSLSVREAYLIIHDARNIKHESAENIIEQLPENKSKSWTGWLWSSKPAAVSKPKLATTPNQSWAGFFRKYIYDNLDGVYAQCMRVFEKYKEHDEVRSVLDEFPDSGKVKQLRN